MDRTVLIALVAAVASMTAALGAPFASALAARLKPQREDSRAADTAVLVRALADEAARADVWERRARALGWQDPA